MFRESAPCNKREPYEENSHYESNYFICEQSVIDRLVIIIRSRFVRSSLPFDQLFARRKRYGRDDRFNADG